MLDSFEVGIEQINTRIDVVLSQSFELIPSRSFAAKLVNSGLARVNGKLVKPSLRVAAGDVITLAGEIFASGGDALPQAEKIPLNIIHEDGDILVINKPAGLVVHPGAGNPTGTLVNAVLAHCGHTLPSLGERARAGIVHRLDRDTSGVMVVAKTQIALTGLSQQFARHNQERWYLAIVYGRPSPHSGLAETWHGRDKKHRIKFAVQNVGEGKIARMRYSVVEALCGEESAIVRCELLTGRTHQIRVQMKHLGFPLLGDPLYGCECARLRKDRQRWAALEPLLVRQMLHAERLQFEHPVTKQMMDFRAAPPDDFLQVAAILRR